MRWKMSETNYSHPWGDFLEARRRAILWLHYERGQDDAEVARTLSMDTNQVYLIRTYIPLKGFKTGETGEILKSEPVRWEKP